MGTTVLRSTGALIGFPVKGFLAALPRCSSVKSAMVSECSFGKHRGVPGFKIVLHPRERPDRILVDLSLDVVGITVLGMGGVDVKGDHV